jgi:hypothetical protein
VGRLDNFGIFEKIGMNPSSFTPLLVNQFDSSTGVAGEILVSNGLLATTTLRSNGLTSIAESATLLASTLLRNGFYGQLVGEGLVDITAANYLSYGTVSPGSSPGSLSFAGEFSAEHGNRLVLEIGGHEAGTDYDQLNITGNASYGGILYVRLVNGFVPDYGDVFTVVTVTGNGQDQLGFDCYAGIQQPNNLYLEPVVWQNNLVLVAREDSVTNLPVAVSDTFSTDMNTPVTLTPLDNDYDPDGDPLHLVVLETSLTLGAAYIDSGSTTVTYVPPAAFSGSDQLAYVVTDCQGAVDSAVVVIEVDDLTGHPEDNTPENAFQLHQCTPNPFNPLTRITFDLPVAGRARLVIYDLRGRRLTVLTDGHHQAGRFTYHWSGQDEYGRQVPSGVYLVRLETAGFTATRKMALVR